MLTVYLSQLPKTRIFKIPDGEAGTRVTLQVMRALTRQGKRHPAVRGAALELVANLPPKTWAGQVRALHAFVRDAVRYVKDTRGMELVQTPERTLEVMQGDCDDKSVLLASLLESIGHPTRFMAAGFGPRGFSHVWVETMLGDKWVAAETTEDVPLGWRPKKTARELPIHN